MRDRLVQIRDAIRIGWTFASVGWLLLLSSCGSVDSTGGESTTIRTTVSAAKSIDGTTAITTSPRSTLLRPESSNSIEDTGTLESIRDLVVAPGRENKSAASNAERLAALNAVNDGRYEDAIAKLTPLHARNSSDTELLLGLAIAHSRMHRDVMAVVFLDRLLRIDPTAVQARLLRGSIRLNQRRFEIAKEDLLVACQGDHPSPRALVLCGAAHLQVGSYAEAEQYATRALESSTEDDAAALLTRSLARLWLRKVPDAESDLAELEKRSADSKEVEYLRRQVAAARAGAAAPTAGSGRPPRSPLEDSGAAKEPN